jgi:hypothetical protein
MLDMIQSDLTVHAENNNPFNYSENQQDANDSQARNEALEVEILTMAGQINSAQYRFIKLLFEFEEQGGWQGDSIISFAHWLSWKVGMGMMMGREKIRVAGTLSDLPLINKAFSSGAISYSNGSCLCAHSFG